MITSANCIFKWLVRVSLVIVLLTQSLLLGNYLVHYVDKNSAQAYILTYIPAVVLWIRGQLRNRGRTVAAAVWLLYSIPLSGIIIWIFSQLLHKINKNSAMDHGFLKNTISLSALVFILLDTQEFHPKLFMRLKWIKVLDILDAADFVGILLQTDGHKVPSSFQRTVISFGLLCVMLTTISLIRLQDRNAFQMDVEEDFQPSIPLEISRLVIQIVLVNFPFFSLRVYLWHHFNVDLSVFTFKNAFVIAVDLIQIGGHGIENYVTSTAANTDEGVNTGSRLPSRNGSRTIVEL